MDPRMDGDAVRPRVPFRDPTCQLRQHGLHTSGQGTENPVQSMNPAVTATLRKRREETPGCKALIGQGYRRVIYLCLKQKTPCFFLVRSWHVLLNRQDGLFDHLV